MKLYLVGASMKVAMLDVYTRARAVGQLADAVRSLGGQHADVVRLVQEVYAEAGKPVPGLAEIDWWLEESELEVAP